MDRLFLQQIHQFVQRLLTARLLHAAATRQRAFTVAELARADRGRREELHRQLEARRQRRVQRRHFRRNPQAYLQALEEQLLLSTLPS